jgi:predicted ferric reductase
MTTFTNILTGGNNRLLKMIIIFTILLLPALVVGLLGTAIVHLLAGMSVVDLVNKMLGIPAKTPWYLSRSAGTVAYLLLLGSTIWGLLLSSKIVKEEIPAALALAMHNVLSWLALGFTGLHAVVLLFDNYYTYRLPDLMIPFVGPYRPQPVGLGIIGFYLMALVTFSFRFRKQIGPGRWRVLHYLSFLVFTLATVHGIAAGTDSSKLGMQIIYLGSGLLVFFLINFRLLTARGKRVNR